MTSHPQPYFDPPKRPAFALPVAPVGKRLISLAINESAFGASPRAFAAAQTRLADLNRYPDPSSNALRTEIAAVHRLDRERIVCGNGSEELLDIIGRLFARPGDEIVTSQSGFFQFALVAARSGATLIRAPEHEYITDIDALLALVTAKTKLVFLAVPNNPTGTVMPLADIRRLHANLPPHVMLVLDLAYGEYLPADDLTALMALAEASANIIATRTFSKAYGLAALRVGWLIAPELYIPGLNLLRGIGNINAVAQAAASAALHDGQFVRDAVARTAEGRDALAAAFTRLGLTFIPGHGNFLLTRLPEGRLDAFLDFVMREDGIWLRPVGEPGFAGWSRIGIGTPDEMRRLITLLERFLLTGRGALK
jgi:histidinol-phosphate aminotransferase